MPANRYVGKTLNDVAASDFLVARGFAGVSVFVKNPGDASERPGRKYANGMNLRSILRTHDELNTARIVDHNMYYGEHVFRVILE